jgi:mRNA interferase RelE/StbE
MRYEIMLSPEVINDLRDLKPNIRAVVRDAIEEHLRHEPEKTGKSRIKRLRGLSRPQYRLRVGGMRVFYDVPGNPVEVLAIFPKDEGEEWLKKAGESYENGSPE